MYCQNCGKELPDTAVICPTCGAMQNQTQRPYPQNANAPVQPTPDTNAAANPSVPYGTPADPGSPYGGQPTGNQPPKKKSKKRWIILGVIGALVLLFGIIAAVSGDPEPSEPKESGVNAENGATTTEATTIPDTTVSDFYAAFQDPDIMDYTLSQKSIDALNQYAAFFPCSDADYSKLQAAATSYPYTVMAKSITKYTDQIILLDDVGVLDIEEAEDESFTYLHVIDEEGNSYVGIIIGTIPTIFDEDIVDVYAMPLDMIFFDNQSNTTTEAIMMAICSCKKSSETAAATPAAAPANAANDIESRLSTDPKSYFLSVNVGTPNSGDVPAPWEYYVCTETFDVLNMRASWSQDSAVITKLDWGTDLLVYGFYDGWAYAETLDGRYAGWCKAEYLESSSII